MLEWVALGLMIFAVLVVFYLVIAVHDIPYEIAVHRNHPHQDAIHVAGWVSLLTLHVIWPFLWIWAMTYREDRGYGFGGGGTAATEEVRRLAERVAALEARLGAGGFSAAQIENLRQAYLADEAKLQAALARESESLIQLAVDASGENVLVAQAKAAPLRPIGVFVHAEESQLVGAFWQNSLQRIEVGDEAEVIFRAVPGRVFKGKVERVLPVLAQGALQASGNLISVENVPNAGKVPVLIDLAEDLSDFHLPSGVIGTAAIYTKHVHHVALIRKILLRMVSWQNYVFGELH